MLMWLDWELGCGGVFSYFPTRLLPSFDQSPYIPLQSDFRAWLVLIHDSRILQKVSDFPFRTELALWRDSDLQI
jgi:hypothetical protein